MKIKGYGPDRNLSVELQRLGARAQNRLLKQNRVSFANKLERFDFYRQIAAKAFQEEIPDLACRYFFDCLNLTFQLGAEQRAQTQQQLEKQLFDLLLLVKQPGYLEKLNRDFSRIDPDQIASYEIASLICTILGNYESPSPRSDEIEYRFARKTFELAEAGNSLANIWTAGAHFTFCSRKYIFTLPIDRALVRQVAEKTLTAFFGLAADHPVKQQDLNKQDVLCTFLADLRRFRFYDLAEQFIRQERLQERGADVAFLCRLIERQGLLTLTEVLDAQEQVTATTSRLIIEELQIMRIELTYAEMEKLRLSWDAANWSALGLLDIPDSSLGEIDGRVNNLLNQIMEIFAKFIPPRGFSMLPFTSRYEKSWYFYFFRTKTSLTPDYELYLHLTEGSYKVHLQKHPQARLQIEVALAADQVRPATPAEKLLIAEILLDLPQLSRLPADKLPAIKARVAEAWADIKLNRLLRQNREAFQRLQQQVTADPVLLKAHDQALNNLAQLYNIYYRFKNSLHADKVIVVPAEDNPLNQHLAEVTLIPPPLLVDFLSPTFGDKIARSLPASTEVRQFPWGLKLVTKTGQEIFLIVPDFERLQVLGDKTEAKNLTVDYLREMIWSLLLEDRAGEPVPTGYLVTDDPEAILAGHGKQMSVNFKAWFHLLLEKHGILYHDFFITQVIDGKSFYSPIKDQTIAGKRQALAQLGPGKLYIGLEPRGKVVCLPVRRKNTGEYGVDSWAVSEEALLQKKLLKDQQPQPVYYALYLVTLFRGESLPHLLRLTLKETEAEILDDQLISQFEQWVADGHYRDLNDPRTQELLKCTSKKSRARTADLIQQNQVVRQFVEPFKIATTFARPEFKNIRDLLDAGYQLEVLP